MDRLTDYDAHGSQYVLILFQWLRADTGDLQGGNPKRDGRLAMLMCVAVNIAASRGELPDPGHDYLEAVEGKEAGKRFIFTLRRAL